MTSTLETIRNKYLLQNYIKSKQAHQGGQNTTLRYTVCCTRSFVTLIVVTLSISIIAAIDIWIMSNYIIEEETPMNIVYFELQKAFDTDILSFSREGLIHNLYKIWLQRTEYNYICSIGLRISWRKRICAFVLSQHAKIGECRDMSEYPQGSWRSGSNFIYWPHPPPHFRWHSKL